jgi:hypothetical protein
MDIMDAVTNCSLTSVSWTFNIMSMIISACRKDCCLLVADTRRSKIDENGEIAVINDSTSKIIRLNDNLALGYAGKFWDTEIVSKILNLVLPTEKSFEEVVDAIKKYISDRQDKIVRIGQRSYFLVGKNRQGVFQQYHIECQSYNGRLEVKENVHVFNGEEDTPRIQIAFPDGFDEGGRNKCGLLAKKLFGEEDVEKVIPQIEQIIKDASCKSDAVNDKTEYILIK